MNWTGGKLQRHSKKGCNATLEKQRQHFAKARTDLQNGSSTSRPRIFGDEDDAVYDAEPVRERKSTQGQSRLEAFDDFAPVVDRLSSMTSKSRNSEATSDPSPQHRADDSRSNARVERQADTKATTKRKSTSNDNDNPSKKVKTEDASTDSMLERQRKLLLSKSNWVGVQGVSAPHFDYVSDRGKDNFGKRRKFTGTNNLDHGRRAYVSSVRDFPARGDVSPQHGNSPSESIQIRMGDDAATSRMAASQRPQLDSEQVYLPSHAGSGSSMLRDNDITDPAQHSELSNLKRARPDKPHSRDASPSPHFHSHARDDFVEATDEDYEKAERLLSTTGRDQHEELDAVRGTVDETVADGHIGSSSAVNHEGSLDNHDDAILDEAEEQEAEEETIEPSEDTNIAERVHHKVRNAEDTTSRGSIAQSDHITAMSDRTIMQQSPRKVNGTPSTDVLPAALKCSQPGLFQLQPDDNESIALLPAILGQKLRGNIHQDLNDDASPAILRSTSKVSKRQTQDDDDESISTLPAILKPKRILQPPRGAVAAPVARMTQPATKPISAPLPPLCKPKPIQPAPKAATKSKKPAIDPDAAWKAFVFGKLPADSKEEGPAPQRKLVSSSMDAQPPTPQRKNRSSSLLTSIPSEPSERGADAKTTAATVAPSSSTAIQSDRRSPGKTLRTEGSDFDRPSSVDEASVMPDVLKTNKLVAIQALSSSSDPLTAGHGHEMAKAVKHIGGKSRKQGITPKQTKVVFNRPKPFGHARRTFEQQVEEEDLVYIGHRGGMCARDILEGAGSEDEAVEAIEDE